MLWRWCAGSPTNLDARLSAQGRTGFMARIVRREQFSELSFLWRSRRPTWPPPPEPGHFVMLRLHGTASAFPLTVADFDRQRGTVTVVVQALGKTTLAMRDQFAAGDGCSISSARSACAAHRPARPRGAGGRRSGRGADLPAAARLQAGRQPHHHHRRLPRRLAPLLAGQAGRVGRRADRLHRRRQRRPPASSTPH